MSAICSLGIANVLVLMCVIVLWDRNLVRLDGCVSEKITLKTITEGYKTNDMRFCGKFLRYVLVDGSDTCHIAR